MIELKQDPEETTECLTAEVCGECLAVMPRRRKAAETGPPEYWAGFHEIGVIASGGPGRDEALVHLRVMLRLEWEQALERARKMRALLDGISDVRIAGPAGS